MELGLFSDLADPRLQWGVVLGASLVAALTDLRARRIPNVLTGPLLLFGLIHAGATAGPAGVAGALGAAIAIAAPFVLLFVFAGGGAGDAKIMGAIGAVLGLGQGALALLCVCLAGVAMGFAWSAARGGLARLLSSLNVATYGFIAPALQGRLPSGAELFALDVDDDQKMPYGFAILAGVSVAAAISLS